MNSITDHASRAYIKSKKKEILSKRAQASQSDEQGEGDQYQYHGSQYRTSQYQGDQAGGEPSQREQVQGENQISPNDQEDYAPYYNYLDGVIIQSIIFLIIW